MNATELFNKDGKAAGVFYCAECRGVGRTQETAEECCKPYKCNVCGKESKKYWTMCDACGEAKRRKEKEERFEQAEKVTEFDGWIYTHEVDGYKDGFFKSVEDLLEFCADKQMQPPKYVWTCTETAFAFYDIETIKEHISENGYEDFDPDDLDGLKELEAAIEKFNAANAKHVVWNPDYKVALVLPARIEAEAAKVE